MNRKQTVLLLRDLNSRIGSGVKCHYEKTYTSDGIKKIESYDGTITQINPTRFAELVCIKRKNNHSVLDEWKSLEYIKPYLRPMSSMSDKEKRKFDGFCVMDEEAWNGNGIEGFKNQAAIMSAGIDWLIDNHFDYRGLIPMGLALEATDGIYK